MRYILQAAIFLKYLFCAAGAGLFSRRGLCYNSKKRKGLSGMVYRTLGRSGLRVSEVGLGAEHLEGLSPEQVFAVVDRALAQGINIIDVFMSEPQVRSNIGMAIRGRRDKVVLQGHIGAAWINGQYARTRDAAQCRLFFEDFRTRLGVDTVDIGMLHYIDDQEDFDRVFGGEIIRYALELRGKGVIRALGMSSHNPVIARQAVEKGLLDVLLFSINPAYDLMPEDAALDKLFAAESYRSDALHGVEPSRALLYQTCEARGVGITVMKPLAAGALLSADTSPFGTALTPAQCIHYALTRPAVGSVLVGCRTPAEVDAAVSYESCTAGERDYSAVLGAAPLFSMEGRCMYCNHCLPCPAHIDIAAVGKYLDMALLHGGKAPQTAAAHYDALKAHAGDCLECRSCEGNCPFHVPVVERMHRAREIFGK